MSTTTSTHAGNAAATPRARVSGPRTNRSNGQWRIDGHDPLNHVEEFKKADNPLNVRRRIIDVYAKEGFDSIATDDLHGRFRWMGLYTQRKQGIDGSRTSKLEAEALSDRYFMMRIRIDGGALSTEQLRTIGGISTEFARGTADLSDRQNIQLHWVEIENVPTIWERLDAVGLHTTKACGDCTRVMMGSPVAGISADEIVDPTPVIEEIRARYIGDPELSNLPRKFKSAITGHPSLDILHELNDVALVGVQHPDLGPGYDLWVGGGLSTAPRLAERLGAFVPPERAVEAWLGVVKLFRDYGYRRQRTKNRLKFLLAEWGTEKFRQVLESEFLNGPLPDGPAPARASTPGDHVGVHEQKDGRRYVGFASTVGRLTGEALLRLADIVESFGSQRIRLTPHQKVLVLDSAPEDVDALIAKVEPLGLTARPSAFRRSTLACTGIEFCKLAFVETKHAAAEAIDELERRFEGVDMPQPIALTINGCQNSCARIQTSDIGLKGQLQGGEFAYQVHLGGGVSGSDRDEAGLGRTVRGLKIAADELPDYVERVTRRWLADREDGETFASWAYRADDEALV